MIGLGDEEGFFLIEWCLGMLSSTETIHVIAEALESHKVPAVVLDPVYIFAHWSSKAMVQLLTQSEI